jgi:hypothetical protein
MDRCSTYYEGRAWAYVGGRVASSTAQAHNDLLGQGGIVLGAKYESCTATMRVRQNTAPHEALKAAKCRHRETTSPIDVNLSLTVTTHNACVTQTDQTESLGWTPKVGNAVQGGGRMGKEVHTGYAHLPYTVNDVRILSSS